MSECQCERLRRALWSVIDTFEGAVANFRSRGAGGQHVPYHGDFSQMPPSTVAQMERWARDLRSALRGEWPYTKEEWVREWGSAGVEEMFKERTP